MSPRVKRLIATGASLGVVSLFATGQMVQAAGQNLFPSEYGGLGDLDSFVRGMIRLIFIIAILAVLVYLVYGGFKWVTSGGDKAKTEEARNTITAAIIGLAIIALSFIVVRILEAFFDINITQGNVLNRIGNARR